MNMNIKINENELIKLKNENIKLKREIQILNNKINKLNIILENNNINYKILNEKKTNKEIISNILKYSIY